MTSAERVSIGFSGGQVVEVRIDDGKLKDLRKALEKGDGWLDIDAEEGAVSIDLSQVVFIRSATTPRENRLQRVKPRRLLLGAAAAVAGAALWWRKNPSVCPYGQRLWVEVPHPLITRGRAARGPRPEAGRADPRGRPRDRLLHP